MRDLVMNAQDLMEVAHAPRKDYAPEGEKRVELHMHSNMSTMDATNKVGDLVAQAGNGVIRPSQLRIMAAPKRFLMPMLQVKAGVKILYGVEANIVDDGVPIAYNEEHIELTDATYVVFDVETTGFPLFMIQLLNWPLSKCTKEMSLRLLSNLLILAIHYLKQRSI